MSGGGGGKVKETSAEKESAAVSYDQWQDFQKRWKPAQNDYIARVRNNYQTTRNLAIGTASNDVDAAFGGAAGNVNRQMMQRGAGLNGGATRAAVNNIDIAQAKSRGLAKVSAGMAADDQHFQQLDGLTAIGRGQQAAGTAGLQSLASLSAASARNDAQIAQNNASAFGEFAGTVGGAALAAGAGAYMNRGAAPKPLVNGGAPATDGAFNNVSGYSKWQ